MKKLIQPLALSAALGLGGLVGSSVLLGQEKTKQAAEPPAKTETGETPLRGAAQQAPNGRVRTGANGNPADESKADPNVAPVKVTDCAVKTEFAVKPKDLSPAIKKGLKYLVDNQQKDGGWNQGGGWRSAAANGGRVEGSNVEDPSDVGNTCFALLALLRAGNTATEGEYKDAVAKGLKFVFNVVQKSDSDSLFITDVRGTQLQGKIGQYVDTFLVNLTLAEYRGKAGDQEKQLIAALEKTMTKIVKHQTADGGFAGNNGWAPTLSVGIANKSLARARERGATVDEVVLKRAMAQSQAAANGTAPTAVEGKPPSEAATRPPAAGTGIGGGLGGTPAGAPRMAGAAGDAGVALYRNSQGAGNSQDIVNSLRLDAEQAKKVIADGKASKDERQKAEAKLKDFEKADAENDKVQTALAANLRNDRFVAGFGNNGGEEFLSFMNISETLVLKGGKDWDDWDAKMVQGLEKAQDGSGSWSGQHCITGKTFCTSAALLVLMADRTPFAPEVIKGAREKKANVTPPAPPQK
jgi:hypothetical protein